MIALLALTLLATPQAEERTPPPSPPAGVPVPANAPVAYLPADFGPQAIVPVPPIPPQPGTGPLLEEKLYPPELLMSHQKELKLDEKQRNAIADEAARAQGDIVRAQYKLQGATEELAELLDAQPLDEKKILAKTDEVIDLERAVKRANLTMLVRVKNLLTTEQREKVEALRSEVDTRHIKRALKMAEVYRAAAESDAARASLEGKIVVVAKDGASKIEIDGKPAGMSPVIMDLTPGKHTVTIIGPDGSRDERKVIVNEGDTIKVIVK